MIIKIRDMNADFQELHNDILEIRDCGEVTCFVKARPTSSSITSLLDDFVAGFKFFGLAEDWKEINFAVARQIAGEIIFKDLAYGVKMTTEERAYRLAEEFLGIFKVQPRFFTNAIFEHGRLSNWSPKWRELLKPLLREESLQALFEDTSVTACFLLNRLVIELAPMMVQALRCFMER